MTIRPDMIKAGAIILNREGRLLIAKSKKNPYWIFVGGRTEPGETLEQCLCREIREELGTELTQCSFYNLWQKTTGLPVVVCQPRSEAERDYIDPSIWQGAKAHLAKC